MTSSPLDLAVGAPAPPPRPIARQPHLWTLLTPQWRGGVARLRKDTSVGWTRVFLLGGVGLGFWTAVFGMAYRILGYFKGVDEIGTLLAAKMLAMTFLAFGGILLLSNLVTALSTFFLAKDLDMMVAAPVDWLRFYFAKLSATLAHSSWMVILLVIPILTAYGIVYDGGMLFPFVAIAAFLPFLIIPTVIGSAVTLILVNIFPARRTKDVLSLVAVGAVASVVLLLRFLQPEQLARPEGFQSLLDFIVLLQTPSSSLLPSEWTSEVIMNWLTRVADPLPMTLLWTTAGAFVVLGAVLHYRLYAEGFSKAQEGVTTYSHSKTRARIMKLTLGWLPVTRREFLLKDLRGFFRDATQWSQLILLGVLLLVYVFNIRALPLFSGEKVPFTLVTLVVFLNQGLGGFVLAAIAARFIFPSVSLEGRQLWLLRSSPLDLRALLWSKYWIGTLPLLILAVLLTWVTNRILQASSFMMLVSLGTTVCFTLAAAALALALGTVYPQFESENAAQIPTSFGGLVFMMASVGLLALIITIEAGPVATYLQAQNDGVAFHPSAGLYLSLGSVLLLCATATVMSLHVARRRLEALEA